MTTPKEQEGGGYTSRERMNDYVGPPIFADVTWADLCDDGGRNEVGRHSLGLLTHTCIKCGAIPVVRYVR